jgi:hypothetical protein
VRRACALLLLESLGLLVAFVTLIVLALVHDTTRLWAAFVIAGFALAGAVFLYFAARGLRRLEAAYRSPVVLLQLLAVPVSIGLMQGGQVAIGLPILVVAVVVVHQLFTAQSRAVLDRVL